MAAHSDEQPERVTGAVENGSAAKDSASSVSGIPTPRPSDPADSIAADAPPAADLENTPYRPAASRKSGSASADHLDHDDAKDTAEGRDEQDDEADDTSRASSESVETENHFGEEASLTGAAAEADAAAHDSDSARVGITSDDAASVSDRHLFDLSSHGNAAGSEHRIIPPYDPQQNAAAEPIVSHQNAPDSGSEENDAPVSESGDALPGSSSNGLETELSDDSRVDAVVPDAAHAADNAADDAFVRELEEQIESAVDGAARVKDALRDAADQSPAAKNNSKQSSSESAARSDNRNSDDPSEIAPDSVQEQSTSEHAPLTADGDSVFADAGESQQSGTLPESDTSEEMTDLTRDRTSADALDSHPEPVSGHSAAAASVGESDLQTEADSVRISDAPLGSVMDAALSSSDELAEDAPADFAEADQNAALVDNLTPSDAEQIASDEFAGSGAATVEDSAVSDAAHARMPEASGSGEQEDLVVVNVGRKERAADPTSSDPDAESGSTNSAARSSYLHDLEAQVESELDGVLDREDPEQIVTADAVIDDDVPLGTFVASSDDAHAEDEAPASAADDAVAAHTEPGALEADADVSLSDVPAPDAAPHDQSSYLRDFEEQIESELDSLLDRADAEQTETAAPVTDDASADAGSTANDDTSQPAPPEKDDVAAARVDGGDSSAEADASIAETPSSVDASDSEAAYVLGFEEQLESELNDALAADDAEQQADAAPVGSLEDNDADMQFSADAFVHDLEDDVESRLDTILTAADPEQMASADDADEDVLFEDISIVSAKDAPVPEQMPQASDAPGHDAPAVADDDAANDNAFVDSLEQEIEADLDDALAAADSEQPTSTASAGYEERTNDQSSDNAFVHALADDVEERVDSILDVTDPEQMALDDDVLGDASIEEVSSAPGANAADDFSSRSSADAPANGISSDGSEEQTEAERGRVSASADSQQPADAVPVISTERSDLGGQSSDDAFVHDLEDDVEERLDRILSAADPEQMALDGLAPEETDSLAVWDEAQPESAEREETEAAGTFERSSEDAASANDAFVLSLEEQIESELDDALGAADSEQSAEPISEDNAENVSADNQSSDDVLAPEPEEDVQALTEELEVPAQSEPPLEVAGGFAPTGDSNALEPAESADLAGGSFETVNLQPDTSEDAASEALSDQGRMPAESAPKSDSEERTWDGAGEASIGDSADATGRTGSAAESILTAGTAQVDADEPLSELSSAEELPDTAFRQPPEPVAEESSMPSQPVSDETEPDAASSSADAADIGAEAVQDISQPPEIAADGADAESLLPEKESTADAEEVSAPAGPGSPDEQITAQNETETAEAAKDDGPSIEEVPALADFSAESAAADADTNAEPEQILADSSAAIDTLDADAAEGRVSDESEGSRVHVTQSLAGSPAVLPDEDADAADMDRNAEAASAFDETVTTEVNSAEDRANAAAADAPVVPKEDEELDVEAAQSTDEAATQDSADALQVSDDSASSPANNDNPIQSTEPEALGEIVAEAAFAAKGPEQGVQPMDTVAAADDLRSAPESEEFRAVTSEAASSATEGSEPAEDVVLESLETVSASASAAEGELPAPIEQETLIYDGTNPDLSEQELSEAAALEPPAEDEALDVLEYLAEESDAAGYAPGAPSALAEDVAAVEDASDASASEPVEDIIVESVEPITTSVDAGNTELPAPEEQETVIYSGPDPDLSTEPDTLDLTSDAPASQSRTAEGMAAPANVEAVHASALPTGQADASSSDALSTENGAGSLAFSSLKEDSVAAPVPNSAANESAETVQPVPSSEQDVVSVSDEVRPPETDSAADTASASDSADAEKAPASPETAAESAFSDAEVPVPMDAQQQKTPAAAATDVPAEDSMYAEAGPDLAEFLTDAAGAETEVPDSEQTAIVADETEAVPIIEESGSSADFSQSGSDAEVPERASETAVESEQSGSDASVRAADVRSGAGYVEPLQDNMAAAGQDDANEAAASAEPSQASGAEDDVGVKAALSAAAFAAPAGAGMAWVSSSDGAVSKVARGASNWHDTAQGEDTSDTSAASDAVPADSTPAQDSAPAEPQEAPDDVVHEASGADQDMPGVTAGDAEPSEPSGSAPDAAGHAQPSSERSFIAMDEPEEDAPDESVVPQSGESASDAIADAKSESKGSLAEVDAQTGSTHDQSELDAGSADMSDAALPEADGTDAAMAIGSAPRAEVEQRTETGEPDAVSVANAADVDLPADADESIREQDALTGSASITDSTAETTNKQSFDETENAGMAEETRNESASDTDTEAENPETPAQAPDTASSDASAASEGQVSEADSGVPPEETPAQNDTAESVAADEKGTSSSAAPDAGEESSVLPEENSGAESEDGSSGKKRAKFSLKERFSRAGSARDGKPASSKFILGVAAAVTAAGGLIAGLGAFASSALSSSAVSEALTGQGTAALGSLTASQTAMYAGIPILAGGAVLLLRWFQRRRETASGAQDAAAPDTSTSTAAAVESDAKSTSDAQPANDAAAPDDQSSSESVSPDTEAEPGGEPQDAAEDAPQRKAGFWTKPLIIVEAVCVAAAVCVPLIMHVRSAQAIEGQWSLDMPEESDNATSQLLNVVPRALEIGNGAEHMAVTYTEKVEAPELTDIRWAEPNGYSYEWYLLYPTEGEDAAVPVAAVRSASADSLELRLGSGSDERSVQYTRISQSEWEEIVPAEPTATASSSAAEDEPTPEASVTTPPSEESAIQDAASEGNEPAAVHSAFTEEGEPNPLWTEPPEMTAPPEAALPLAEGQTADATGDGVPDTVSLVSDGSSLTLNINDAAIPLSVVVDPEATYQVYVVDIDPNDGGTEIVVQGVHSGYSAARVYRYANGDLQPATASYSVPFSVLMAGAQPQGVTTILFDDKSYLIVPGDGTIEFPVGNLGGGLRMHLTENFSLVQDDVSSLTAGESAAAEGEAAS